MTKKQKGKKKQKNTKRQKDKRQRTKREFNIVTSGQFRTLAMFFLQHMTQNSSMWTHIKAQRGLMTTAALSPSTEKVVCHNLLFVCLSVYFSPALDTK